MHTVCDLSVSFKVKSDDDVEPPYIISNQKNLLSYNLGKISPPPPPHTPLPPRHFVFQNLIISSLCQKEGHAKHKHKVDWLNIFTEARVVRGQFYQISVTCYVLQLRRYVLFYCRILLTSQMLPV